MVAASAGGKKAAIWDLRPNYQKSIKDFEFEKKIDCLTYDQTGKYLLFATEGDIYLVDGVKFNELSIFRETGNHLVRVKY